MARKNNNMIGRVIKGIGGFYYVSDGINSVMGKARGNLKRNKDLIYVGDIVNYDIDSNNECIINEVVKRENFLTRPPVSNLEMLVVVYAAANPEVNFPVIDKLIAACEQKNIEIVVCVNKIDLVDKDKLKTYIDTYNNVYPTIAVNGIKGEGIDELKAVIKGKNVALAGPSGVGKSTITNFIAGEESAETGDISDKTQRGKHTTRHVEIFELEDGTNLYDTPGFTSLDLQESDEYIIKELFPEFRNLSCNCKYTDCLHINEPDCAVKPEIGNSIAQSRYDSYLIMFEEAKKWLK